MKRITIPPTWIFAGGTALLGLVACGGGGGSSTASTSAPTISTQPQNQTVTAPATATFTVVAAGNPIPSYQWNLGGTAIPGATSATYTTPATAAGTFSYTCTVTNSVSSVTSNAAVLTVNPSTTPSTMTVTGTIMVNYLPYDAGTRTITPDPRPRSTVQGIEAIVDGASYPGTYDAAAGTFSIPNVPVGFYTLVMAGATRTFTFYSNQPTIVLDYDQQGRATVQYPTTASTDVIFNTSGMTAWTANNYSYLTFFDPNADLYSNPDAVCYSGYPVTGATALSALGVNWYSQNLPLVDTARGDAPILAQLVDITPAGPSHLATGQNLYYPAALTILDSSGATIGGSFTPEAQTGSVRVNYLRSGFAAYRGDFNTGATHRSPHFEVDDSPGAATYYQTDSVWLDRLWFDDPTSTADIDLGSVPTPPILPGFDRVYYAGQHSYLFYQLPGNSAYRSEWFSIYTMSKTEPTSGSPIAPLVSHPRSLSIGSTNMLAGVGILATGVGTTPTFTWQVPALGTPQGYKVDVYEVSASGGQTQVSGSILRMFTTATQVQCPPNLLVSGNYYIFSVKAIADSSYTPLTAPFHFEKLPYAYAYNVSGIFVP